MVQRRRVILGTLGVGAGLVAAGCSSENHAGSGSAGKTTEINPVAGTWQSPSATAAAITMNVTPEADKTGVLPTDTVTVSVDGGKLVSCSVVSGGKKVAGTTQDDGTWKTTGSLAYGKTYKVTATVTDSTGNSVQKTSSFSTVKPHNVASITFQANGLNTLKSGATYGMGQPVIVAFSHTVTDKAAAEKAIDITTSPAVDGKFYWVNSTIVHWRPAKYWAKGTTIKVNVNAYGVNLGNNVYGGTNASTNFTIGRQLRAVSDNNAHHTKVYIDGKLVRDMLSSNGRGGYTTGAQGQSIHFWTQNGPHVVLSREAQHSMSSASYGVTNKNDPFYYAPEIVKLCTRISYSGEFLHAAPWNHELGKANISHGCINLSIADAQWVYDNFMVGDVVEVVHSPKELPITDGLGDWTVSYDRYGS